MDTAKKDLDAREVSRKYTIVCVYDRLGVTADMINQGSLQRIADAIEKIERCLLSMTTNNAVKKETGHKPIAHTLTSPKESTVQQRRMAWMNEHAKLIVGDVPVREIILQMKDEGVYSKKTYWRDVVRGTLAAAVACGLRVKGMHYDATISAAQ